MDMIHEEGNCYGGLVGHTSKLQVVGEVLGDITRSIFIWSALPTYHAAEKNQGLNHLTCRVKFSSKETLSNGTSPGLGGNPN